MLAAARVAASPALICGACFPTIPQMHAAKHTRSGTDGARYKVVRLANGSHSLHSIDYRETFHPVIGPEAEAEALYLNQLRLAERLGQPGGEFVIWDVGLGAAANVATVLRGTRHLHSRVRVLSFDYTTEPLELALRHPAELPYLIEYAAQARALIDTGLSEFTNGRQEVRWQFHQGDFPATIAAPDAEHFPKPHAIMFDAFSPATNPAMWTLPLFTQIFQLLDTKRPCALPTYSRSTLLRVTLLLAGFFVGVGHPTGQKDETTIAANQLSMISEPLDPKWLARAHRSSSAEPLWTPVYRQARLAPDTYEKLRLHPQFR